MDNNTDKVAGRVKQAAGDLTDDNELHKEGKRQEMAGKIKDAADKAKETLDHAVDKVREKMDDR
jgi:uncharacterized protein YjbJ (UPF0337 family)